VSRRRRPCEASAFSLLPEEEVERGIAQLAADPASAARGRGHGGLRELDEPDACHRLLIAAAG
jgi:hypothetical protein